MYFRTVLAGRGPLHLMGTEIVRAHPHTAGRRRAQRTGSSPTKHSSSGRKKEILVRTGGRHPVRAPVLRGVAGKTRVVVATRTVVMSLANSEMKIVISKMGREERGEVMVRGEEVITEGDGGTMDMGEEDVVEEEVSVAGLCRVEHFNVEM